MKRFVAIWFRSLLADWMCVRRPELIGTSFVFSISDHNRLIVTAVSRAALQQDVYAGMVLADAKAIAPGLQVFDDKPGRAKNLLRHLGTWCIRYSPAVSIDGDDGLILDVSGCPHLWGGEREYLTEIRSRLASHGYEVRLAIADTIGAAWAISRYGTVSAIVKPGEHPAAILPLPPAALRLEGTISQRLHKLGLSKISTFISMSRAALRRRFGDDLLIRIDQAMGTIEEHLLLLEEPIPYQERLACLDPIRTAKGIEMAIAQLLDQLCARLKREDKGIRNAILRCFRIDGKIVTVEIGTNRASQNAMHLFSLFELKIPNIEPALGIEVFVLEAIKVEEVSGLQEKLWAGPAGLNDQAIAELLDRLQGKLGQNTTHRFLPAEHHWPEWSLVEAKTLNEKPLSTWQDDQPRPIRLLARPELIEVAAPIPDYPPMNFRHRGTLHTIKRADGPERIEQEWWLQTGEHRDYYRVEDENGQRFWVFRSGHYQGGKGRQWYLHGFFA